MAAGRARRDRTAIREIGPSAPTLNEVIRIGLEDEISAGRLAPGAEIDEQQVAERFGASRTPVREALRELAAAGLVEIEPRRGARVTALSIDRLGEMFEVMAETEALCTRLATNRMTAAERFDLQRLHRASRGMAVDGDIAGYDEFNREFHSMLYRGAHNSFLADHATRIRARLAPFRRAQFRSKQRLQDSFAEHEAIVFQMLRGDGEEAARLMRAHVLIASAVFADLARLVGLPPGPPGLSETIAGKGHAAMRDNKAS